MKLSPRQEATLAKLGDLFEADRSEWTRSGYYGMRTNTLDSLADRGLAERRLALYSLDCEYRISPDGLDELAYRSAAARVSR